MAGQNVHSAATLFSIHAPLLAMSVMTNAATCRQSRQTTDERHKHLDNLLLPGAHEYSTRHASSAPFPSSPPDECITPE